MSIETPEHTENQAQRSLSTAAARNLASTTKSEPQMQGISSRWLTRSLPWIEVKGGVYRVNRRLTYTVGDGKVQFSNEGAQIRVIPRELRELPQLRGIEDDGILELLARRFEQRDFRAGEVVVEFGNQNNQLVLIAHGKVSKIGTGDYGEQTVTGMLADGDYIGETMLIEDSPIWPVTAKTLTDTTILTLSRAALEEISAAVPALRDHLQAVASAPSKPQNKHGEAEISIASGHIGEPELPSTFVDYELQPREYELGVAQSVLRVHTRVADLYNEPHDQIQQQLRLTIEALQERREHELINNRSFGLLHNADLKQRIYTQSGAPTPDDFDELLSMRRSTRFFLAHPKAIAAFGRECNKRGLYPDPVVIDGRSVPAWRGVPIFPCGKIPVSDRQTTSILAMRVGEKEQGVVGLHQTGIPDEIEPSLNVRFKGIDDQSLISYLVSLYYSAAVLVPDALGVLDNVLVARQSD